ncbi:MAG: DinB family protein [Bryobacteraceae bacterium]
MNYYGAKELAAGFRTVRQNTIVIANEIPEDQYGFRAAPESRTVAQTLVHIAVVPRLQEVVHRSQQLNTLEGFDFLGVMGGIMGDEQKTRTKSEIIALLTESGESLAAWMEGLSDEFLGEPVAYPQGMTPPVKSRFEMIMSAKEHEMHHRGQLMVIERMLGIVPHLTRQMLAMMAARAQGAK